MKQTEIEPGPAEPKQDAAGADSSGSAAPNKRKRAASSTAPKNGRSTTHSTKTGAVRKRKPRFEAGAQDTTQAETASAQKAETGLEKTDSQKEDAVVDVQVNISEEIKPQSETDAEDSEITAAQIESAPEAVAEPATATATDEASTQEDTSEKSEREAETEAAQEPVKEPKTDEATTQEKVSDEEAPAAMQNAAAEIEEAPLQEDASEKSEDEAETESAQEPAKEPETDEATTQEDASAEEASAATQNTAAETEEAPLQEDSGEKSEGEADPEPTQEPAKELETDETPTQEEASSVDSTEQSAEEAEHSAQEEHAEAAHDDAIEEDPGSAQAEEEIALADVEQPVDEAETATDALPPEAALGDSPELDLSQEPDAIEEDFLKTLSLDSETETDAATEHTAPDQIETGESDADRAAAPEPEIDASHDSEEEFEEEYEKKRFSMFRFFMGSTAVFTFMSALFVVMLFLLSDSPLLKPKADVVLPYFGGKKLETIQSNPDYSQFHFEVIDVYTNEQSAGTVVDQSPKPPKNVKENAKIILRVSAGQHRVEVPTVAGMTRADAKLAFNQNDLNMMVKPEQSDSIKEGSVVRTDPIAGTTVDAGATIVVYISQGKALDESTVVPSCTGISSGKASQLLTQRGLTLGLVNRVASESPAGTVISQSPSAGSPARRGSAVALTVSKGADEPIVTNGDGGDHAHNYVKTATTPPTESGVGFSTYTCTICQMATYGDFQNPTG